MVDLWYDLIAPDLKTPMAVETWRNGKGTKIRTKCNRIGVRPNSFLIKVYNINLVKLPGKSFASTKDHSKWGVSTNETAPVVCIGDVNRQESQFKRGGGAVCVEDFKLWKTFYDSVGRYEDCRIQPRKPRRFEKDLVLVNIE
ncbi:hypothetical protein NECAME_10069 [Necator americanus]|uniref:Uncharacterized protein n=1 Tax=Necator americanus TaxID=51031 RepID=W2TDH2_NECAM|nr:hypothetical protein NECAME_10069 [Necator americanus]ETN79067.1 hypothetical protein NECAME_10069 [Necator americanus]